MRILCHMMTGYPQLAALVGEHPEVVLIEADSEPAVISGLGDCEAFIAFAGRYTSAVAAAVNRAPRLRWLHFVTAGIDPLWDHPPPAHIQISSGGAVWATSVAEHALAMALGLVRRIAQAERDRAARCWGREAMVAQLDSLRGRRILIVGFGAIGKAIADLLRPFEATLVAVASRAREQDGVRVVAREQLREVLPQSEIVFVAMPLTPDTRHLLDAQALALLPAGAALINVARGGLLDERALLASLREGRCQAALDVFSREPLPADHPLWTLPNVILTPHVAGFGDPHLAERVARVCHDNLSDVLAGRAPRDKVAATQLPRSGDD